MAHYFPLDWTDLRPISIPTLMVRPMAFMTGFPDSRGEEELSWPFSSNVTVVKVPGDHFTMMADHADTTAQAVIGWLTGLAKKE